MEDIKEKVRRLGLSQDREEETENECGEDEAKITGDENEMTLKQDAATEEKNNAANGSSKPLVGDLHQDTDELNDVSLNTGQPNIEVFAQDSDAEYDAGNRRALKHKLVPSNLDPNSDIRIRGKKTSQALQYGLEIIKKSNESIYDPVTFDHCKFKPTGCTTFFNCQFLNVTFQNCKFKGKNRFDNCIGKDVTFSDCTFDNHWEGNVTHEDGYHDKVFDKAAITADPANRRILDYHFYDESGQEGPPPKGIEVVREEHECSFSVNFRACTFDEDNPTVFEKCALKAISFTECHFSGCRFENVYASELRATGRIFRDCRIINVEYAEGEELKRDYLGDEIVHRNLPQALRERRMGNETIESIRIEDELKRKMLEERRAEAASSRKVKSEGSEEKQEGKPQYEEPQQEEEDKAPITSPYTEWDVATKGKGKGNADG